MKPGKCDLTSGWFQEVYLIQSKIIGRFAIGL